MLQRTTDYSRNTKTTTTMMITTTMERLGKHNSKVSIHQYNEDITEK